MAKKIIEARVIQKVGTEAEWSQNDLKLYKGELALVQSADDVVNIKVGTGNKTFRELPYLINYVSGLYTKSITRNSSPSGDNYQAYIATEVGVYPNFGNVEVPKGFMGVIFKNLNNFEISLIKLPNEEELQEYINEQLVDANLGFGGQLTDLNQSPTVEGIYMPKIEGTYPNFNNLTYDSSEGLVMFLYKDGQYQKIAIPLDAVDNEVKNINTSIGVSGQAVEKFAVKKINNIAELRNTKGEYEGQVIELLGYYEAGDKPSIKYKWTATQGVDDGGSVINSGNGSWIAQFGENINVKHFGAIAEVDYDNSVHFSKLTDYLSVNPYKVVVVDSGNNIDYETSSVLNIPINTDIIMNTFISFTNDNNSKGIIVGNENDYNFRRKALIRVKRKTLSDWENKNNIGVEVWNLYESIDFNIQTSQNFTTGVKFIGKAKGCVYNTINVGVITNSRYQFVFSNLNNGWCNENLVFINRLQNNSTTHVSKSRFGIVLTSDDGLYSNNNNVFHKPSIELNSKAGVECRAIVIDYGSANKFYDIRNEGNSQGSNGRKVYLIKNDSSNNIINEGYGLLNPMSELVEESGVHSSTMGSGIRGEIRNVNSKPLIYDSGLITSKVSQYDETNLRGSEFIKFGASTNVNFSSSNLVSGFILKKNSLLLLSSRGIGVTIDTSDCKKFVARTFSIDGLSGRFRIRCFDENDVLLTDSDKKHVKSTPDNPYSYYDNNFKAYGTGANANATYFEVSEETKKIDFILTGNYELTRFQIFGVDKVAQLLNGLSNNLIANILPTNEVNEGTFYYNNNNNINVLGWIYLNNAWVEVPKLVKSTAISDVTAADATDLESALTLVNELKDKLNAKLTADRNSGQQAIQ